MHDKESVLLLQEIYLRHVVQGSGFKIRDIDRPGNVDGDGEITRRHETIQVR